MLRWILAFSAIIVFSSKADEVIEEFSTGAINWSQGRILAQGFGTAKDDLPSAQKRLLSRRAAVVDGQRNLLEITKGVRLTSMTKVGDRVLDNRVTASRVQGVIRGAVVIKESYQNDIYTVTMAMPIAGDLLYAVYPESKDIASINRLYQNRIHMGSVLNKISPYVLWLERQLIAPVYAEELFVLGSENDALAAQRIIDWIDLQEPADIAGSLRQSLSDYASGEFSGLLIDATQVQNFELATIPTIRGDDGTVIYPNKQTSYADIANKRGVSYDLDIGDAVKNARVARLPLIVRAITTYEGLPSDLVLGKEDVKKIMTSKSAQAAMNKAGVMIVISI
jgi:hypothetical protein